MFCTARSRLPDFSTDPTHAIIGWRDISNYHAMIDSRDVIDMIDSCDIVDSRDIVDFHGMIDSRDIIDIIGSPCLIFSRAIPMHSTCCRLGSPGARSSWAPSPPTSACTTPASPKVMPTCYSTAC